MQRYLYERCRNCNEDEMVVLAPRMEGYKEFDSRQNFTIHRWSNFLGQVPVVKRFLQLSLPLFGALYIYCRDGFDLIECGQALPFGAIALLFERVTGTPYIVWTFGNDILKPQKYPFLKPLLCLILKNAVLVISISEAVKEEIVRLDLSPEKILVINPPTDTRRFRLDLDTEEIATKHRLRGKRVLLTVGRLVERKGIDAVIKAMPKVIEAVPNVVYLIMGAGPDRNRLERGVRELELGDKVIFTGRIPEEKLPLYYNACDLFVMPSRTMRKKGEIEGFGIVYLEAGACGKPVIGGKGGGTSDAIEDGVTGLLVDPLAIDQIADAIVRILQDSQLARRLGENGRRRAIQRPNWHLLEQIPLGKR